MPTRRLRRQGLLNHFGAVDLQRKIHLGCHHDGFGRLPGCEESACEPLGESVGPGEASFQT